MTSVVLRLPMPPSVNALWRSGKRRVYASPKYKAWKTEAGWALNQQRPKSIKGSYLMDIYLCRPRKNADLDNYSKAISDLLQEHGIIENDKLALGITMAWGAAEGCIVNLESRP